LVHSLSFISLSISTPIRVAFCLINGVWESLSIRRYSVIMFHTVANTILKVTILTVAEYIRETIVTKY